MYSFLLFYMLGLLRQCPAGAAPLPWFLLSQACVVPSVAIYIPMCLGTRPAGAEKGHGGPAKKEMQKTFSFWAESVLRRFGIFFLLFVLRDGRQNFSFPFVGPPLSTRATALGHARPGPPGCAQTTMQRVSFTEVWEKKSVEALLLGL